MLTIVFILDISISDKLLITLLLMRSSLLVVHFFQTLLLCLVLTLSFGLFFFDSLTFLFLSATISILLFLVTSFLFFSLSVLFFSLRGSLGLSLCHLLARILFCLLLCSTVIVFWGAPSKNLLNVRRCVDSSCCSTEHCLEEEVSFFRLVTSYDFCRLHVYLFPNNKLSKLDQLD